MKNRVIGIASAAAVVMAVLGLAIGSTFVRASNQDIVDTAVGAVRRFSEALDTF